MSPTLITYIGFVVAALILVWAVLVITQRYFKRRKADARTMNTWVPLKPNQMEDPEEMLSGEDEDQERFFRSDVRTRAQQNGHYSESHKTL